ncbi:MAG: Fe-S cluster assembly protein SufD [Rhodospirillaceae bacterium]|nr:Fe-S cluster assembly protein SufD [Rhodospirillaceae bacterium]
MTAGKLDGKMAFDDTYANAVGALPGANESWVDRLRQTSRAILGAHGIPGPKTEAWKYTSLNAVANTPFIPATKVDDVDLSSLPLVAPFLENAIKVVFINGVFRRDLSDEFDGLGVGVAITPFADVLNTSPNSLKDVLGVFMEPGESFTAAMNTGFMEQGAVIHLSSDVQLEQPIQLISIGASGSVPCAFHPRFEIVLEAGALATVVESHFGLPGQPYLSNPASEILLGERAILNHYITASDDSDAFHLGRTAVSVEKNAKYDSFILSLGGGLVRREIKVRLEGDSAAATVDGAYGLSGNQHSDILSEILHLAPETVSNQMVKGVLAGDTRGVFQGRIYVARDAQRTNGRQLHKALLLNRGPEVDCKPELEIYADDVQCAHGATTGEMDPGHIFYLMSRGIDETAARALLVEGFLDDVVLSISDEPARKLVLKMVKTWLAKQEILTIGET